MVNKATTLFTQLLPGDVTVETDDSGDLFVDWTWEGKTTRSGARADAIKSVGIDRVVRLVAYEMLKFHPHKSHKEYILAQCRLGTQRCYECQEWNCCDNTNPDKLTRMDTDDMLTTLEEGDDDE